jgi:uncharacterized lipoprotein
MLRLLVPLCALALSACGLMKGRELPYRESGTQPPLQVPEDLDRPVADQALRVPDLDPSAGTRNTSSSVAGVAGGDAAAATPARVALSGGVLTLADSPQSTWRRVGLALERMGDVEILERDEAGGRYRVEVAGARRSEGWIGRLFRREELVRESFDLVVEPSGEGSRLRAVEGGELAANVLQRLRDRLG